MSQKCNIIFNGVLIEDAFTLEDDQIERFNESLREIPPIENAIDSEIKKSKFTIIK